LSTLAKKIARVPRRTEPTPTDEGLSRRQFITATAFYTPPLLAAGAAALGETQLDDFRVRRLVVPIANLPPALEGITIAHVSDVHVGRFTRGRVLERIVEETNRLDADFVAMTGDLINDSLRAMPAALEMMRGLRARQMVVACEGNHDLIENRTIFYREAEKGGLPLLRSDSASVTIRGQKVQFLGLPWNRDGQGMRQSMQELMTLRDPSAWPILLAHHPHAWDSAADIPLTLSGHTHGGQLMLTARTGFGSWWYRYWSGLYTRTEADRALVVSNGVGNWFPVRIQAPAEILHLTLQSAPKAASASSNDSKAGATAAISGGGARRRSVVWT
jgi:predicted MPP superfamily phosphohydrolase